MKTIKTTILALLLGATSQAQAPQPPSMDDMKAAVQAYQGLLADAHRQTDNVQVQASLAVAQLQKQVADLTAQVEKLNKELAAKEVPPKPAASK